MKNLKVDAAKITEHLKLKIGFDWAASSVPRAKQATKLINPPRTAGPWLAVQTSVNNTTLMTHGSEVTLLLR